MPKLDVSALKKAIVKGQAAAVGSLGPGGRPRTGTKAFVREHLDTIIALREETHATWAQVVQALGTAHPLLQGDNRPMTGRRLHALVCACLKERERAVDAGRRRHRRSDLAPQAPSRPQVSLEERQGDTIVNGRTPPSGEPDAPDTMPLSEDEIRRVQAERHQHLFKQG